MKLWWVRGSAEKRSSFYVYVYAERIRVGNGRIRKRKRRVKMTVHLTVLTTMRGTVLREALGECIEPVAVDVRSTVHFSTSSSPRSSAALMSSRLSKSLSTPTASVFHAYLDKGTTTVGFDVLHRAFSFRQLASPKDVVGRQGLIRKADIEQLNRPANAYWREGQSLLLRFMAVYTATAGIPRI